MSPVDRRRLIRGVALVTIGTVVMAICTLAVRTLRADPMVAFEVISLAVIVAWGAVLVRHLWRGREFARALAAHARPTRIQGIECRLVTDGERRAFVLGALRPTIYLGEDLLTGLDPDELRAVLLHEEYHRQTLGPLRAASLQAWLSLAQPISRLRDAIDDRLVDLERAADRYALRRGASTGAIASALIKIDAVDSSSFAAFASAADRRVGGLLEFSAGRAETLDQLPYEWLPPVAALITVALCHVLGILTIS